MLKKEKIEFKYKDVFYYGGSISPEKIKSPAAQQQISKLKRKIALIIAEKNFWASDEEIESGSAFKKLEDYIQKIEQKINVIGTKDEENNIKEKKVSLFFKHAETMQMFEKSFPEIIWRNMSKDEKGRCLEKIQEEIAHENIYRKWQRKIRAKNGEVNGDDLDFAFNEENALLNEEKEEFLQEMNKEKCNIKFVVWK